MDNDIKSRYNSLDMPKLMALDQTIANELKEIKFKTNNFKESDQQYVANFNDLYEIVRSEYPDVINTAAPATEPEPPVGAPLPTMPTLTVVRSTAKEEKAEKDSLPTGVENRQELLKAIEQCEQFLKENRPKVGDLRGHKKAVRRSDADLFADKVASSFKMFTGSVKDEAKVEKLKKATHRYISEIRSIMGYPVSTLEKKIQEIAAIAEKRIEKAA